MIVESLDDEHVTDTSIPVVPLLEPTPKVGALEGSTMKLVWPPASILKAVAAVPSPLYHSQVTNDLHASYHVMYVAIAVVSIGEVYVNSIAPAVFSVT